MPADGQQSIEHQLIYCENMVEDSLKDRLGASNSPQRNAKLRDCIERLQSLCNNIEDLSMFSTNDQVDELPTSSLHFLLVHAYLAYTVQEIHVEREKRKTYLISAKANYQEFLQNLLIFELINFKLPWLDADDEGPRNSGLLNAPKATSFEEASAKRAEKIARHQQMRQLEDALNKLRNEERRNDDEAAQRETILTLLRLWSIRALKELGMIEEEMKMLEHFEASRNEKSPTEEAHHVEPTVRPLKPFIIARSQQQKQVFGLGYPSIPTVTVDEWFDQMQKTGGFGKAAAGGTRKQQQKFDKFTIEKSETEKDEEEDKDENDEAKRRARIRMDEWKDMNPRGSGNTYNKG